MAIIGIQLDRTNPEFTVDDFTFWMPQFVNFMNTSEGIQRFEKIYGIVNQKIFKSIFGSDWELAMSYGIAHYITLIGMQMKAPAGNTIDSISGGGVVQGVLTSASVGSFSKSYDTNLTLLNSDEDKFWNQTSYGAKLMALLKTKAIPSIMVVTSGPLEGAN